MSQWLSDGRHSDLGTGRFRARFYRKYFLAGRPMFINAFKPMVEFVSNVGRQFRLRRGEGLRCCQVLSQKKLANIDL